jgi:uncharacterized protein (DUF4415 family)
MAAARSITFTRLADGTLLQRRRDGTFHPVRDRTDLARLKALTVADIETMSKSDPDHPALDNSFWKSVTKSPGKEAISIKLDRDILKFFRKQGRGYQTRINAVLRRFVDMQRKAG